MSGVQPYDSGQHITYVRSCAQYYAEVKINKQLGLLKQEYDRGVHETSKNNSKDIQVYKFGARNIFNWCSFFANWAATGGLEEPNLLGLSNEDAGRSQQIRKAAQKAGVFETYNPRSSSNYTPKPGDNIIWTETEYTGHIGTVYKVYDDGSFDTIEGNYGNKVSMRHFDSLEDANRGLSGRYLAGFVNMEKYRMQEYYEASDKGEYWTRTSTYVSPEFQNMLDNGMPTADKISESDMSPLGKEASAGNMQRPNGLNSPQILDFNS